ncbi:MAG: glycosyltransferase family 2 protein [Candidatus Omnitrophica bacterium]|nr:glycosyltransferase family 2 protein [Candidatus Omnitrophota bacterium]
MNKLPLSVVVIAKNEEANIDECFKSVYGWADEIVLVDDESTDRTVEVAKRYGATIYRRKMDNEGIHRNWAYAQAKNEWVLSLDADEKVTEELKEEISQILPDTKFSAFSIPLRNFIGTYWVRYGGWYPAGKLRLFMRSRFKYEEVGVHPRVFLNGDTGHLTKDIIHKGYPDFEHFLGSLNRQTTLEAQKWIETGRQMSFGRASWRTIYQIMSYAKYWQMKKEGTKK